MEQQEGHPAGAGFQYDHRHPRFSGLQLPQRRAPAGLAGQGYRHSGLHRLPVRELLRHCGSPGSVHLRWLDLEARCRYRGGRKGRQVQVHLEGYLHLPHPLHLPHHHAHRGSLHFPGAKKADAVQQRPLFSMLLQFSAALTGSRAAHRDIAAPHNPAPSARRSSSRGSRTRCAVLQYRWCGTARPR